MGKVPGIAHAKQIRALLDSHAVRQKNHEARLDLRKRIRDHGIATTARMDKERLRDIRADTPAMARTAEDMRPPTTGPLRPGTPPGPRPGPPPRGPLRPPRTGTPPRPMRVDLTPSARGSRSRSSVGSRGPSTQPSVRSIARSTSSAARPVSTVGSDQSMGSGRGSVGSLIARFSGLGHTGGAPARRPAKRERDLSRYQRTQ
jgi:hypothetical protein